MKTEKKMGVKQYETENDEDEIEITGKRGKSENTREAEKIYGYKERKNGKQDTYNCYSQNILTINWYHT